MRVAAVIGPSGSGKTSLITALIRRFVTAGRTVGAIKHTHHPLNEERRGDTSRFAEAGADPVVFAGAGEAVVFRRESIVRIAYAAPRDLLDQFDTDIVLIEGFKSLHDWPRIELPIDLESAAGIVEAI